MKRNSELFSIILLLFFVFQFVIQAKEAVITIQKGDTLYSIAQKHNLPVAILMKYNNITDATKIKAGTKIMIPVVHRVKKGETLYSIAREYCVTVNQIIELNSIPDIKKITIGQLLVIPYSERENTPVIEQQEEKKEENNLLWPHPGKRDILKGKLKGVAIEGKEKDTIVSVSSGKVIWAEAYRGFGKMVLVQSKNGYIYIYAGNDTLFVNVGEDILRLTPIGLLGNNPHDGKPRVYFCVYRNGKPIDPYKAPRM